MEATRKETAQRTAQILENQKTKIIMGTATSAAITTITSTIIITTM
jgi:hypothetical protein